MFLQTIARENNFLEVKVMKDVLSEYLPAFKEELYVSTCQPQMTLVLNFEGVRQLCSRALGVIAVTAWRIQKNGGTLVVANLNHNLRRIFKYARLDQSMTLIDTLRISERPMAAVTAVAA